MKRNLIAAFLLLLFLFSAVSCSFSGIGFEVSIDRGAETTTAEAYSTLPLILTEPESTYTQIYPEVIDFGGEKVNVTYWNDSPYKEFTYESNAEIVDDAIYKRNGSVAERLNIEFEWVGIPGGWDKAEVFLIQIKNKLESGDPLGMIASYSRVGGTLMANGLLADLNKIENSYINLDQSWWPVSLADDCSIDGSLFWLTGDISTNLIQSMYTVFYNKSLAADLDLPADVDNGKWTLGRMLELSKQAYTDGIPSFSAAYSAVDALYIASGLRYTERGTGENYLELSPDYNSSKTIILLNNLTELQESGIARLYSPHYLDDFSKGTTLFCLAPLSCAEDHNTAGIDYGILPPPLFDEKQSDHFTYVYREYTLWSISRDSENKTMLTASLECLASESYRNTSPAIFEYDLKRSYYDPESDCAQVYDMMRESVKLDLGVVLISSLFEPNLDHPEKYYTDLYHHIDRMNSVLAKIFN